MIHRVVLSNGRVMLVEERSDGLHIGEETQKFPNEAEAWICTINPSGVLVMPNSGDAPNYLCEGIYKHYQVKLA